MKRQGKTLQTLPDGAPRRLANGRNAWRKMTDEQRRVFLGAILIGELTPVPYPFKLEECQKHPEHETDAERDRRERADARRAGLREPDED
jgi:hypothetical protein